VRAALLIVPLGAGLIFLTTTWAQNSGRRRIRFCAEKAVQTIGEMNGRANRYLIKESRFTKPFASRGLIKSSPNRGRDAGERVAGRWPRGISRFFDVGRHGFQGPRTIVRRRTETSSSPKGNGGRIRVVVVWQRRKGSNERSICFRL